MGAAERTALASLVLAAACASPPYEPCPVPWQGPLPPDVFQRCREQLLRGYPGLLVADAEPLRLQTAWLATSDPPGERRAAVFLDDRRQPPGLAVVVELRWLRESWITTPGWSEVHGDDAAERELAAAIAAALKAPR